MRLQAHRFERRTKFSDYAVLYRGNHQARVFEQVLRKEKIPYVLSGGQSFFERAEIRDLMAYLRLLANDDDDPAFIRAVTTPKRGVGTATLAALGEYSGMRHVSMFAALFESGFESRLPARQLEPLREFGAFVNRIAWRAAKEPAAQVLDDLVAAIGYRAHLFDTLDDKQAAARWQNVTDFVEWLKKRAEEDGSTLVQLAQSVAILSQLDRDDAQADAVRLTTIHAAKGLEFPHVFIAGCEEGLLPHHGGLLPEDAADASGGAVDASGAGVAVSRAAADASGAAADRVREARIEEERRLMYVAVTRAQRGLTLTWCKERRQARQARTQQPSRFIAEMQLEALPSSARTVSQQAAREQLGRLRELLGSGAKPQPR
jgi:ATP-dependent DNA helicase Rep